MAKYCVNCGKELADGAVLCPSCGVEVKRGWSKGTFTALCILTVLMPIIGFIAGFIGISKEENKEKGITLLIIATVVFIINWIVLSAHPY